MSQLTPLCRGLAVVLLVATLAVCTQPAPLPAALPPTTAPTRHATSMLAPFPGLTEWDLLIISDSSNMGVGAAYARLIESDRAVKVTLHDCWIGSMSITQPLDLLRLDAVASCGGKWRDLVRDAEVIVLFGNSANSSPADGAWTGRDKWTGCIYGYYRTESSDPAYRDSVAKSCAPATFAAYKTHLNRLYDMIFELRAGRPVILRATDSYVPVISDWEKAGIAGVCSACYDNFAAVIHQAAAEHGVPVASSLEALNGPDHRSDPFQKGYILPDGLHLTEAGAQLVADTLRQTGYSYAGK